MKKNSGEAKYQIFISSTYEDLTEERSRIIKEVLRAEQLPVAMEHFVASDKEQWDTIQRFLDGAGCVILIIGSRYGTIEEESGKSYTEKEYDYACDKNIPILSFIKAPKENSESNFPYKKEYDIFVNKVKNNKRLVSFFSDITDLVGAVASSIYKEKNNFINPWYCQINESNANIQNKNLILHVEDLSVQNYWNEEAIAMYDKYKTELDKLNTMSDKPLTWEGGRDFKNLFEIRDDNNMITKEMHEKSIVKSIRYVWTDKENQMWVSVGI